MNYDSAGLLWIRIASHPPKKTKIDWVRRAEDQDQSHCTGHILAEDRLSVVTLTLTNPVVACFLGALVFAGAHGLLKHMPTAKRTASI